MEIWEVNNFDKKIPLSGWNDEGKKKKNGLPTPGTGIKDLYNGRGGRGAPRRGSMKNEEPTVR